MKTITAAMILALGSIAAAQTPIPDCKLKAAQAPALRGIRLGMNVDQALGVFPGANANEHLRDRLSNPRFGVVTIMILPGQYGSKDKFVGVRSVDLGFLDGELNFFSFMYNGPSWDSAEQFASSVAESLKLPGIESWRQNFGGQTLKCEGFQISVQTATENSGNTIQIKNLDTDVDKIVHGREEAIKDASRRAFKP